MKLKAKRDELDRVLGELDGLQTEYAEKEMPTEVGEKFDSLATEASELQGSIDAELARQERYDELKKWSGADPRERTLPTGEEVKNDPLAGQVVAGYMTLGEYVTAQKGVQEYMDRMADGGTKSSIEVAVPASILGGNSIDIHGHKTPIVPLSPDERKAVEAFLKTKAIPTIGTGVIEPTRLPGVTQQVRDDDLVLRDVMSIAQTSSNSVEYIRRTTANTTQPAAIQTEGTQKAEGTIGFDLQTATVRTIAGWIPVTTQQLADWPMLRSEIDNFLMYGVRREEEEQLIYGPGTGTNLTGLEVVAGTTDISGLARYVSSTHTLLDAIRMGITEVRTSGYRPNAVLLHPIEWESIVLLKATDNSYIWAVVQTEQGPRIWGVRVVESETMQESAGNSTEQRNLIVGDFQRGCTLIDRMAATVMIGLDGNDFTSNMRTILAEERVAFAIRAPAAFAKLETQALSA